MAISPTLRGENAFYRERDYLKKTKLALNAPKNVEETSHYYNTEVNIERFAIKAACLLIPPYGLHQLIHLLAGKTAIIPAATPSLLRLPSNYAHASRRAIRLKKNWKIKRLTIKTNGNRIDAIIMGTPSSLATKRWVLYSGGNGEFWENSIQYKSLKEFLKLTKSNLITFNYPGVGSSTGTPTRKTVTMAYRAVLHFLEDPLAIGAEEIIAYGFSIGAAIQGEVMRNHRLKYRVKYVLIKSRTFSDLSTAARYLSGRSLNLVTRLESKTH